MRAELVTDALEMAARNYYLAPGAIFHSDREAIHERGVHRDRNRLNVRQFVVEPVCCDNAQAESFNAALKVERVNRTICPTCEHARTDIARYIEFRYYNCRRLHSALVYRTQQDPTTSK